MYPYRELNLLHYGSWKEEIQTQTLVVAIINNLLVSKDLIWWRKHPTSTLQQASVISEAETGTPAVYVSSFDGYFSFECLLKTPNGLSWNRIFFLSFGLFFWFLCGEKRAGMRCQVRGWVLKPLKECLCHFCHEKFHFTKIRNRLIKTAVYKGNVSFFRFHLQIRNVLSCSGTEYFS